MERGVPRVPPKYSSITAEAHIATPVQRVDCSFFVVFGVATTTACHTTTAARTRNFCLTLAACLLLLDIRKDQTWQGTMDARGARGIPDRVASLRSQLGRHQDTRADAQRHPDPHPLAKVLRQDREGADFSGAGSHTCMKTKVMTELFNYNLGGWVANPSSLAKIVTLTSFGYSKPS